METYLFERKMDNCKPCGGAIPLCMIDEFALPEKIVDRKVTLLPAVSESSSTSLRTSPLLVKISAACAWGAAVQRNVSSSQPRGTSALKRSTLPVTTESGRK